MPVPVPEPVGMPPAVVPVDPAPPAITAVATDVAAFVGFTVEGPVNQAVPIESLADFAAQFGAAGPAGTLPHALRHFFDNGGRRALIVRVTGPAGEVPGADDLIGGADSKPEGISALAGEDFGVLVLPDASALPDADAARVWQAGLDLCRRRGAFLIVDAPADIADAAAALAWRQARFPVQDPFGACYAPWIAAADPATGGLRAFPPSGFVAGLYARTDIAKGVWKAPAGTDATLIGADHPAVAFTEAEQEQLNPLGVNLIRAFPGRGILCWGAHTLASGTNGTAGDWTYVPVRRLGSMIERSLTAGLNWAVFEPNTEALWARVRAAAEDFLYGQWQAGAFAGQKPDEAFFVRCDPTTMTQNDLDNGRLVLEVGIAPTRPAEFVIFRIGQWTADKPEGSGEGDP